MQHRIVSLLPSATEIVCALGCEESLVGRSHECDYPKSVKQLPVCTEPKFDSDGTSYEIDQRVKALLQETLSVYRVNVETLERLHPDVIITQSQCEVCAVSLEDVNQLVLEKFSYAPNILSLSPNSLDDIWMTIQTVARSLDVDDTGAELIQECRQRIESITGTIGSNAERPTIACIEWIDPLMAAGNWIPELVHKAGGINLFGVAGEHSPWLEWQELISKNPDVIIVMPCGFDIEQTKAEMGTLTRKAGWSPLRAVKDKRVYIVDGNQYFNRPGPRMVDSFEILAEVLQKGVMEFGYENKGWISYYS